MENTLLSIPEACEKLRIGKTRLYEILNAGQIKAVRMGKRTLIPVAAIDDFINGLEPFKTNKGYVLQTPVEVQNTITD